MIRLDIKKIGVTNGGEDVLQYLVVGTATGKKAETLFSGTVNALPGVSFTELYALISALTYAKSGGTLSLAGVLN